MDWKVYRLVFRLKTPLHIGRRGWGIIQRTRPYLMGKNLWAAATARLTCELGNQDYAGVGEALKGLALFTYCYPATDPELPLLPHFQMGKGLYYGNLSAAEFEYRFIGSYAATAIDPATQAAEAASLHEIEVLLSHTRDTGAPVYLCGYVLLREGGAVSGSPLTITTLSGLLRDVQVGGERGYGFGRLFLQQDGSDSTNEPLFGEYQLEDYGAPRPILTISGESPLPAHALITGLKAAGDIEPLTGREWGVLGDREGAGQRMLQGKAVPVCYVPGSIVEGEKRFAILADQYGILKVQPSTQ